MNEPGKVSVLVCTDDGIPRSFEYSGRGVDGRFVFENPPLVTGNLELVVDADGASLSGLQDLLGNLHHWSVELEPVGSAATRRRATRDPNRSGSVLLRTPLRLPVGR